MSRKELLDRLDQAAIDLEFVDLPMVFVGGATMPLYVDEQAGAVLCETRDVDVMVEAGSYGDFADLAGRLRANGFHQDLVSQGPRCRWFKEDRVYDIVDIRTDHPNDQWARPTSAGVRRHSLPSGRVIPVLSPGRFLAAKVAALQQRGGRYWYESPDFEDIVLILESNPQLQPWLADTPRDAVLAVAAWAEAAIRRPKLRDEIEGTVTCGADREDRVRTVFERLHWLAFAWPNL